MVDRITRSNSIRNTLCCCFYYLCLWLSFVRLCPLSFALVVAVVVFLLSEVKFVCWKGKGGEGGTRRSVARQRKARRLLWGLLLHKKVVCKVTYSHCGSTPSSRSVGVCAYKCVYVCSCLSACGSVCAVSLFIYFYDVSFLAFY